MLDYLRDNGGQILDGLLFGLGVLAVYLGAVFTGALIRSLGGAGSKGLTAAGRYLQGWFYYLRGDDRDIINVTLNVIVDNQLKFDTMVADRRIWFVWPNAYRQSMIRGAARRTTEDNPVIAFAEPAPAPNSWAGRFRRRCDDMVHDMLASVKVVKDGKARRVRLQREDDYKATYGPLISLVSEKCTSTDSIDLALGRPMDEYRFVIALTYEKLSDRRARHLRAMVMWEQSLLTFPRNSRASSARSTRRATARCRRLRGSTARIRSASGWSTSGAPRTCIRSRRWPAARPSAVREPQAAS